MLMHAYTCTYIQTYIYIHIHAVLPPLSSPAYLLLHTTHILTVCPHTEQLHQ